MATTIFTDYGQQLITEAIANKTTINITKIAVGDGMGAVYTPVPTQTALKRETWSGPIDSVQVNPTNKNQVTFEGIVGANVGGFYIREIGLYDQANKLVAISDFPESFKALADQYELYVRMILQTGSADVTNIIINKDMIYATKKYVDTEVAKKYTKPTIGIPKADLESSVQTSLVKADSALQSVTKSDVGLSNVDNTSDANKPVSTAQQTALNLKANIASPTFTGTPKSTTAAAGTNTTQIATTAFVKTAVDNSATTINDSIATHKADNVSHDTYVSCTTASATAEKVVTSVGFTLVEGARITVKFANANTVTVPTLKINTEVAKPLVKADGTAFKNIKSGIYSFVYSGTSFTVQGEGGEYGTAIAGDVLSGKTIGTDTGLVTGTMPNRGVFNLALGASVPAGYYSGGTVPNGKRWASGTLKSSSGSNGYFLDTNGNPTTSPYITFPGLAFIPSKIILKHNSFGVTTWSYDDLYYTSSSSRANAVANDNWYRVPYTTPMNIPVTGTGADYEWIAYE